MSIAPKQDWAAYQQRLAKEDAAWVRGLTPGERFDIYANLFAIVWRARHNLEGDWEKLEQWHWQQKLAMRQRCVRAYQKRDEIQHGRAAAEAAR
jgi:hypothetical protein